MCEINIGEQMLEVLIVIEDGAELLHYVHIQTDRAETARRATSSNY